MRLQSQSVNRSIVVGAQSTMVSNKAARSRVNTMSDPRSYTQAESKMWTGTPELYILKSCGRLKDLCILPKTVLVQMHLDKFPYFDHMGV